MEKSITAKFIVRFAALIVVICLILTTLSVSISKKKMKEQQRDDITIETSFMVAQIEQKLKDKDDIEKGSARIGRKCRHRLSFISTVAKNHPRGKESYLW